MKIAIIGNGNVATHLHRHFSTIEGMDCVSVNSRTLVGLPDDADIYLISVSDTAIPEVASRIPAGEGIVAHTSGSIPMEAIGATHSHKGVFYPLQTFSKQRALDYSKIPVFVEGESADTVSRLHALSRMAGMRSYDADSEGRRKLHIASVFGCNFANKLWEISSRILEESGFPDDVIRPLLHETLDKLDNLSPLQAQTGPASRNDLRVVDAHIVGLREAGMEKEAEIYALISESIIADNDKRERMNRN